MDWYRCAQYVVIYWDDERLLAFTFDKSDTCIASTVHSDSWTQYVGKSREFVTAAMASIFHYPSIWIIRPES